MSRKRWQHLLKTRGCFSEAPLPKQVETVCRTCEGAEPADTIAGASGSLNMNNCVQEEYREIKTGECAYDNSSTFKDKTNICTSISCHDTEIRDENIAVKMTSATVLGKKSVKTDSETSDRVKSEVCERIPRLNVVFYKNCILGRGGFGQVFLGKHTSSGRQVAVKELLENLDYKYFEAEVQQLKHYTHENLLRLVGYSSNGVSRYLVYEYMPNGSLQDRFVSHNFFYFL